MQQQQKQKKCLPPEENIRITETSAEKLLSLADRTAVPSVEVQKKNHSPTTPKRRIKCPNLEMGSDGRVKQSSKIQAKV